MGRKAEQRKLKRAAMRAKLDMQSEQNRILRQQERDTRKRLLDEIHLEYIENYRRLKAAA